MSSDIYKNQQRMPFSGTKPKRRRRRTPRIAAFDESGEKRRRSRNSGLRRVLHVMRKSDHEKKYWWGFLVLMVVLLTVIGIWQFWYLERVARGKAKQNEVYVPLSRHQQAESPRPSAAE